jgi:phosphate transport system protein
MRMTEMNRGSARSTDEAADRIIAEVEGDLPLQPHTVRRPTLDREQREIKDTLLRTSSLVEVAIASTVEALETHDAAKAVAVIDGDAAINDMTAAAVEEIVSTIATQSPVARDLRFLLTLYDVAMELERIGDYVANIAKRARDLAPEPSLHASEGVARMGRLATELVADVMRALVDSDVERARRTAARDDEMDILYHRTIDETTALAKQDPGNVERAARLQFAAHYMERIGDRVTNIAEAVVFLSTGLREDLN